MRCLFVIWNTPLSYMYSGTSCRAMMDFEALVQNNVEVFVLRFLSEEFEMHVLNFEKEFQDETRFTRSLVKAWTDVRFSMKQDSFKKPIGNRLSYYLQNPADLSFPKSSENSQQLLFYYNQVKPSFVWTIGGQANAIAVIVAKKLKNWVVVHTDWYYMLINIRKRNKNAGLLNSLRTWWLSSRTKRTEFDFIKRAKIVITGSSLQKSEMLERTTIESLLIPQAYPDNSFEPSTCVPNQSLKIFHVGGLVTTSNYIGLISYLKRVHNKLLKEGVELHIIGSAEGARADLIQDLKKVNSVFHGFQYDLRKVLLPFDVQIIPYEFETGLRSKIPLLFMLKQVVICTKASVAGMPELENGVNCIICDKLEQFENVLRAVMTDRVYRSKIGEGAYQTFVGKYALKNVLPLYADILNNFLQCNASEGKKTA